MLPRPSPSFFVGRVAERRRLAELWVAAELCEPFVALVSGHAGVGKTRLLEEAADLVRASGGMVMLGCCVGVSGIGLPYLPIIDALRSLEATPEGLAVFRRAAARWPALGRLLPYLLISDDSMNPNDTYGEGQAGASSDGFADGLVQGQLFQAVHRLLTVLAEPGSTA